MAKSDKSAAKPDTLTDADAVANTIAMCVKLREQGVEIKELPTRDTLPMWVENLIGQLLRSQREVGLLNDLLKLRS